MKDSTIVKIVYESYDYNNYRSYIIKYKNNTFKVDISIFEEDKNKNKEFNCVIYILINNLFEKISEINKRDLNVNINSLQLQENNVIINDLYSEIEKIIMSIY